MPASVAPLCSGRIHPELRYATTARSAELSDRFVYPDIRRPKRLGPAARTTNWLLIMAFMFPHRTKRCFAARSYPSHDPYGILGRDDQIPGAGAIDAFGFESAARRGPVTQSHCLWKKSIYGGCNNVSTTHRPKRCFAARSVLWHTGPAIVRVNCGPGVDAS